AAIVQSRRRIVVLSFFFQAEDGIRYRNVTGVQTCALPISRPGGRTCTGGRPGNDRPALPRQQSGRARSFRARRASIHPHELGDGGGHRPARPGSAPRGRQRRGGMCTRSPCGRTRGGPCLGRTRRLRTPVHHHPRLTEQKVSFDRYRKLMKGGGRSGFEPCPDPVSTRESELLMEGFKKFLLQGNLVQLAVAVVVGAVFADLITAFTEGFITPLLGIFGGVPTFGDLYFEVNDSRFMYGAFVDALVSFLLTAAVL